MINLFEYQNKVPRPTTMEGLEAFLDRIWNNRERSDYFISGSGLAIEAQRFIQFIHKSDEIKSNKYVGVIHFGGRTINLLPKIFFDSERNYSKKEVAQIHYHILWWLSYCRKTKFPSYNTQLGNTSGDFFEVLIYQFSKYTRELLNSSVYRQYQEVSNELPYIKGRLDTNTYINENISTGRWHKLSCTYDAFVVDNKFNRIIKDVTKMLFNVTMVQENKKYLREILFMLDEVGDKTSTAEQCMNIFFNPMLAEFEVVRDYCILFLSGSISYDYKNDMKLFAFLIPMEYLFEDFVFGFINKELPDLKAKSQRSDTYLDEERDFNLRPDLYIETPTNSLIADTKYKIVYSDESDPKKGIKQGDLYQMLAYAVRFNVDEIILFYPNTVSQDQENKTSLIIKDALADDKEISIKAFQLPIINRDLLNSPINERTHLRELFESTKQELKKKIEGILMPLVD